MFFGGVFGLFGGVFAEQFAGGKFDSIIVAVERVRGAGDFESSEIVPNGEGDFTCNKTGVWCNNGGAEDAIIAVNQKFNKAIIGIIDFAGKDITKWDGDFLIFAVATNEIVFSETNNGDFGVGFRNTDETIIIDWTLSVTNKVCGKSRAFEMRAIGG